MQITKLIRSMKATYENQLPVNPILKANSSGLGIRYCSNEDTEQMNIDIFHDSDLFVYPDTGGLSVNIPPKLHLPPHHITPKKHIFYIETFVLYGLGLKYRQDPRKKEHFFIEPIQKMPIGQYEEAIKNSRDFWQLYLDD